MIVQLLTEHHLELLSLKGGCTGSSESTFVKMPHCWKSHVTAHMYIPVLGSLSGNIDMIDEHKVFCMCCIGKHRRFARACAYVQSC